MTDINKNQPEKQTLFEERKIKLAKTIGKPLWFKLLILLGLLLVIRFGNNYFWFQTIQKELEQNIKLRGANYIFLGWSTQGHAEKLILKKRGKNSQMDEVVAYFDPLHHACFMVQTGSKATFIDLGKILVSVGSGLHHLSLFPSDILKVSAGGKAQYKFVGNCLLKTYFNRLADKLGDKNSKNSKISYIYKPIRKSKHLKFPYLIYFFVPLVCIVGLISTYSYGSFLAFFYFVEMFLLFDYQMVFLHGPFHWATKTLGISVSSSLNDIIPWGMALIFAVLAVVGILHWRKTIGGTWERSLVLFFFLLPLFLRF